MGNRAVITTPERKIGLYLQWNGGRDTVEPLLRYCELQGYRPPSEDDYGWARMCQVVGNFFGGTLSVGIGPYTTDRDMDPGDNGIYVVKGWKIVERLESGWDRDWKFTGMREVDPTEEQRDYGFDGMLRAFDEAMPEELRLGGFLDAVEIPVAEVRIGDEVWLSGWERGWEPYPVVGFGEGAIRDTDVAGKPYVERFDHDGGFSLNAGNYLLGETAFVSPRGREARKAG